MLAVLVTLIVSASPELEDGRAAVSRLEYQKAIIALTKVTSAASPSAERAEAYSLLARSYLALGRADEAQAAFEGQLTEEPMAEEPAGAPKVKQAFLKAKRARYAPTFVQLRRRPSESDVLEVEVVNPWRLTLTIDLSSWTDPAQPTRRPVLLDGSRFVVGLAAGTKSAVRVLGSDGVVLASLGSLQAPIEGPPPAVVVAPPPAPKPTEVAPSQKPDAPRSTPLTPNEALVPVSKGVSAAAGLAGNRPLAWTLAGVGAAATIAGLIVMVLGFSDISSAEDLADFTESDRLKRQGELKTMLGGVIGGVGLVSLGAGVVLLLSSK
jgi:tetratricopeptide (TPR) repeat protein